MKLNNVKLLEILRKKNSGWSSYQARKESGVSERRVNQIWQEYCRTGNIPKLGKPGRPTKPIEDWERKLVRGAYDRYGLSASPLEKLIHVDYGKSIPHNRVHRILLDEGFAKKAAFMPRKKDWIRYERRHSLTAVHIDWHQRPNDGPWVFAVEDDASRFMLSMTESNSPSTETSIKGMEDALKYGCIKECISDHGAQFTSNAGGESRFRDFLDAQGIRQILCRIKHPQSNGKIERFFWTYEKHRDRFESVDKFRAWYNEVKPHMSLDFNRLETPWQAFQRKMKV